MGLRLLLAILFAVGLGQAAAQAADVAQKALPVVWVLSTGGTIAGVGASPTAFSNYKSGSITGQAIVDSVPALKRFATVKVEQVVNVPSASITIKNWLTLANRINEIFTSDPDVAGIVVTSGTDTLEETAYFLDLTVKDARPVVVVGSMRPSTAISADGPVNMLDAVRTAASPDARGKGVLVVLNDEINAARDVTKTNTFRVETFRSPELGQLGDVDEDKVTFYRTSTKRNTVASEFDIKALTDLPKVEILYSYIEPSTVVIDALVSSGVDGIVFAGVGAGGITRGQRAALQRATAQTHGVRPVVVRSSRVGAGRVISNGGADSAETIAADSLNPQKARILLMLALTKTRDLKEIQRMFSEY